MMTKEVREAIRNATWFEDKDVRGVGLTGVEERCLIGDHESWHFVIADIREERRRAEGFVRKDASQTMPLPPELALEALYAADRFMTAERLPNGIVIDRNPPDRTISPEKAASVRDGSCPDCNASLTKGPSAGLSVNWHCEQCGARFNVVGPFSVERI